MKDRLRKWMGILQHYAWDGGIDWHFKYWTRKVQQVFFRHHRLIEFLGALALISTIVVLDNRSGWTRISEGAVTGIGIVVATWVGLLTLHTLQHSIQLSREEDERQKLTMRPVLMVNLDRKDDETVLINDLKLKVKNGGLGPALDIRVNWYDTLLNYDFRTEKEVGVFALGSSEATSLHYVPRKNDPLSYGPSGLLNHNEILRLQTDYKTGLLTEEEFADAVDAVHASAVRNTSPFAGRLRLLYFDLHGREWETTADVMSHVREANPLPLVHDRWPEALIASVRTERAGSNRTSHEC
jgi:hypothetical protein